jgi:gliding motility-associated-like protein
MKTHWKFLLSLLILFNNYSAFSQIDTVFWFAAPEVSASAGDSPIYLRFMTYSDPANVTMSLPANGGFTPINLAIPANSVDSIDLTSFLASIESPAADVVSNNGIKVLSDVKISAYYELKSGSNKEIFILKGTKALGDDFYAPFQNFWDNGATAPASFSSIDIVATENNTTVLITPRTNVVGHVQDVTYSVVLNEGETYSARDMNVSATSTLAGSIISSDKPIAITLFSGALSNGGCLSSVGDQITNSSYTGQDFIVHKGTSSNDRVYILGTQNGTAITVTNTTTTSTLINWGETYEIALTDTFNYIQTTKPVYLWHVSGYGCELSGAQVPNLFCMGTYETAFTRTTSDSLGLILYTRTGYENQFTLNGSGVLIPGSAFSDVPGTGGDFKVATIYYNTVDVPINSYNIVQNSGDIFGLGVINGNGGNGSSYGYLSEFNSYPFVDAGIDDTICANTQLTLNGIVGGGTVTGLWSTTGFGSFAAANDVMNNTYIPSALDTLITPIELILTSTGPCPVKIDTLVLEVEPAPIVSASADQSVCENNATVSLAGTVSGGASTGVWSSLGSGTFSPNNTTLNADYVPSAADLTNGSVQLVLTSTNFGSCLAETDTMEITFTVPPSVDAGVDTIYACENNPDFTLSGTVTGVTTTGKWTSTGTGVFAPDNQDMNATYQPSPLDISGGSVWIYLESTSNQSCNPEYDSVIVIFTAPPVVDAGANVLSCTNDASIDLAGVISGATTTGTWTGGTGAFSPNANDLNATYTPTAAEITAGTIFLTLTSTNNGGCLAENDNMQINFITPPFANFNFTEECLYDAAAFSDFSLPGYGTITNWDWDFGDLTTSTNQNETHFYSAPGTYDVQLIVTSDVGCSDTITQQVQSFEVPVAGFSYTSDCPNNQIIVDFTDESTTVSDAINYWFYDFGGQGNSGQEDPSQLFSADGDYSITHIVGTVNGCYDTIVQILNVPPYPQAGFSYNADNSSNLITEVNFVNNATNETTYFWDFGNSESSTEEDPSVYYTSNGNYIVTQYVTGALGCVDSVSQIVIIDNIVPEEDIPELIPNAISPNGDNKNDVWKLEFLDILYPNARVEVFNEWGQSLFYSDGYEIPWDGTYKGELVPDGTYYYVIDLQSAMDETDIHKGTILVLKSKN